MRNRTIRHPDNIRTGIIRFFPLILFLLNFLLKLVYISSNDIAIDEPLTLFIAQKNTGDFFSAVKSDNNPPLYYLLMHFWTAVFGNGAFSARFPSVLFSALSSVALFRIGQRFFNLRTGIIASLIFTGSSFHVFYAHDARAYSMLFFLASASTYYFLRFIENEKEKKSFWMLLACNVLMCYTHFFGFVVVAMQGLCTIAFPVLRKVFAKYSYNLILLAVFYAPYIPIIVDRYTKCVNGTGIEKPLATDLYTMLWRFSNAPVVTVIFIILLLAGLVRIMISGRNKELFRLFLVSFIVPFVGLFMISFTLPVYLDRYLIFTSLYYYVLLSVSVDALLPETKSGWIVSILFPGLMLSTMKLNPPKKRNIREVVEYVRSQRSNGDVVILTPAWFDLNFAYYYRQEWFRDNNLRDSLSMNNIFPANNVTHIPVEKIEEARSIIYIDNGSDLTDPRQEILKSLQQTFPILERMDFYEHLIVYHLKK